MEAWKREEEGKFGLLTAASGRDHVQDSGTPRILVDYLPESSDLIEVYSTNNLRGLCPYCFICCVSKHILLVVNIIGWHQPDKCTVMLDFKLQFCSLLQEA